MAISIGMVQHKYVTGVLMDKSNIYSNPPRHQVKNKALTTRFREETVQQSVNETLKEAALINIVAAVNDNQTGDGHDRYEISAAPGSAIDSLSNTMAVISNLMNAGRRTVSIPRSSKIKDSFNLPKNTIQKKPVYYKHSDDEEVSTREQHRSVFTRIQCIEDTTLKIYQASQGEKRKPAKEVVIKSLPTRPHTIEYNVMHNTSQSLPTKKQYAAKTKERESESRSSVRKLGSLKRTETRQVHRIPRCDAVDLSDTDTSANLQEMFSILSMNDQRNSSKRSANTNFEYYRTKSLPAMLPNKTTLTRSSVSSQSTRNSNSAIRGRHLSRSITKRTPDSLYKRTMNMPNGYGFEKLAICNGVNQDPDIVSPVAYDSTKSNGNKQSFAGLVTQKSSWKQRSLKPPILAQSFGMHHEVDSEKDMSLLDKRFFLTDTEDNFREAVKSAMNGNVDSHYEEVNYSITPTGISSSMSMYNAGKGRKHMQFVRRRFLSDSSDDSYPDDKADEDKEEVNIYHDTRMIHAPGSTSLSYSPISANQLLRIQQKIIPANIKNDSPAVQHYFSTTSSITLQQPERQKSDLPRKAFVRSDEDADKIAIEVTSHEGEQDLLRENMEEQCESEPEFTEIRDIACSPVGRDISTAASNSQPETTDKKSSSSFYKLVKAVDSHSYAEFEHKKLRRLAPGVCGKALDNQTTEFVKIRL